MARDEAIIRLARQIDAARKAERFLENAGDVEILRRRGACELHGICAEFVNSVNGSLPEPLLDLSPPEYAQEAFRPSGVNLMQIGSQGREMQIAFEATPQLFSTEKFATPYVLEGEVRTYNQKMLERFEIWSRLLFYCVEKDAAVWRFYDWRTLRTGLVDRALLVGLMEPLF